MADKSKWFDKKAAHLIAKESTHAFLTMAERILFEAINEAPIDTGTLRRSGTVTVGSIPDVDAIFEASKTGTDHSQLLPKGSKQRGDVYISFNTPYAKKQHEGFDFEHPRGGKWKYLEDPVNRNRDRVKKYVELKVRLALQKAK